MKYALIIASAALAIGLALGLLLRPARRAGVPPQVLTESIVLKKTEQVLKIVVVEYFMSDIIDTKQEDSWPWKDKKVLILAQARVLAGFDLHKGFNVAIDPPLSNIVIRLPKPEIVAVEPIVKFYDIQGRTDTDLYNWALSRARRSLAEAAKRSGILEKARDFAELSLKSTMAANGYGVDVLFVEAREPAGAAPDAARPNRGKAEGP